MRRRHKILIQKTLWFCFVGAMLSPVIVQAFPNLPNLLNKTQEIKIEEKIKDTIKEEPKKILNKQKVTTKPSPALQSPIPIIDGLTKPPLMIPDAYLTPIVTPTKNPSQKPTPIPTPIPLKDNPILTPPILLPTPVISPLPGQNLSCSLTNTRPLNAKWIAKNKSVGMGIRYTVDIFELKNQIPTNNVSYYYILHDKITRYSKKRVIGNFTINYQKQNPTDKTWELEFNGCGPKPKDDNSIAIVTIYDNDEMLKSMKLIGNYKSEKIGLVQKPSTNIGVLNQLDLTESK